jgi:hypothetical protein
VGESDGVNGARRRRDVGGFDPVAALTDAQRRAIETADASFRLFTRFLGGDGNHHANGSPAPDGVDDDQLGFAELRRSVTRSLDLYLELAERFFDSSTRSFESALRARGVSVTGAQEEGPWTPVRPDALPGGRALAKIWLHNSTTATLTDVTFRPTDLTAHTGATIGAAAVTIAPSRIEDVSPGTSVGLDLSIEVSTAAAAGLYAGYVLVSPVPDAVLPVLMRVGDGLPNGNGAP